MRRGPKVLEVWDPTIKMKNIISRKKKLGQGGSDPLEIVLVPYKRPTEGWKSWVGVPNLEKYTPNGLNDEQAHYMINNKKRISYT